MTHSLVLFQHGAVTLAVFAQRVEIAVVVVESVACLFPCSITFAALVEEKLGHVEVFLIARGNVEFSQAHFGNLMAWHHTGLTGLVAHFAAHAVGILDGYVEEVPLACGIVVGYSGFAEVAEVVELMAEVFHTFPTLLASPLVGMLGVLGARGVEVAVRLLTRGNHGNHAIHILVQPSPLELGVGVGLQQITRPFDSLVGVGVVEGIGAFLDFKHFRRVFQVLGRIAEVGVAAGLLALREGKGDGHVLTGFQALSPEGVLSHFYFCERHLRDGVATVFVLGSHADGHACSHRQCNKFFH